MAPSKSSMTQRKPARNLTVTKSKVPKHSRSPHIGPIYVRNDPCDRIYCDLRSNPLQSNENKFLSLGRPGYDDRRYLWYPDIESDKENHKVNVANCVALVSEFREFCRYMRLDSTQFLSGFTRRESSNMTAKRVSLVEYNALATKLRADRAGIKIPYLPSERQQELFDLDLHPTDMECSKWEKFYKIMGFDIPADGDFPMIFGERDIFTNFIDDDDVVRKAEYPAEIQKSLAEFCKTMETNRGFGTLNVPPYCGVPDFIINSLGQMEYHCDIVQIDYKFVEEDDDENTNKDVAKDDIKLARDDMVYLNGNGAQETKASN